MDAVASPLFSTRVIGLRALTRGRIYEVGPLALDILCPPDNYDFRKTLVKSTSSTNRFLTTFSDVSTDDDGVLQNIILPSTIGVMS
jgi:hypothetical protein